MIEATVSIDLSGLKRFEAAVTAQLASGTMTGPVGDALKKWAHRYRTFLQRRFKKESRGGGAWPPLKSSTVSRRRGGARTGRKVMTARGSQTLSRAMILYNTGTLFAALSPTFVGGPGAIETKIPFGVRVGYGGPGKYPSGAVTVADIASFHQVGGGNLPVREIIVVPDGPTIGAMRADMMLAIRRLENQG